MALPAPMQQTSKSHRERSPRSRRASRLTGKVVLLLIAATGAAFFVIPFAWMLSTAGKPGELVWVIPPVWIPPTYQWRKAGVDIPGATSASYTIDPVGTGDAGSYDVVVTNVCNTATSSAATLTVGTGPAISQSPVNQHVFAGAVATFSVNVDGNPAPSFQWRKDGVNLSDDGRITGATTATLRIDPVTLGDAGNYNVFVDNACGSVTSDAAALTVFLAGDLNCDSLVDFGDINPFVLYLSSFSAWRATYAGCPPENGDIDGDGTYGQGSFGDINPFVALLGGGG